MVYNIMSGLGIPAICNILTDKGEIKMAGLLDQWRKIAYNEHAQN